VADIHQLVRERAVTRDDGCVPQLVELPLNLPHRRDGMGEVGPDELVPAANGWSSAAARPLGATS
jgi:hypothetical protein